MKFVKSAVVAVAAVFIMFAMSSPAHAVAAKFHKASATVTNSGGLVVSFDERGVGNENIDYTLTASANATYACINGGGKHPKAANKEAFESTVSAAASFEPRNGRVIASISVDAPAAASFQCPNGQKRVLAAVSYTNIVVTDVTNGSRVSVPDASEVFYNI